MGVYINVSDVQLDMKSNTDHYLSLHNSNSVSVEKDPYDVTFLKLICITVVSLLIIACNVINLFIVSKTQHIPRITRICLLNLSFSDLLVGLVSCLPCSVIVGLGRWPYGAAWCQIAGIVHGSSVTISILSLSLVSIDRFLAIRKPLKYRYILTVKRTYVIIFGLWLCAICTFASPLPTKTSFIYYQYSTDELICGLYWEYKWFCIITAIYIPLASGTILISTNVSVMMKVISSSRRHNRMAENYSNVRYNDIRAVKMLIAASVVYFILWGPYVIQVVIISLFDIDDIPGNVRFVTMWLANSNSFTNVFVYSFMYRSFRKDVKMFLSSLICCKHDICPSDREVQESLSAERSFQMSQYG